MLDQLQSHGLLTLSVLVSPVPPNPHTVDASNRNAGRQSELAQEIGRRLGLALRPIVAERRGGRKEGATFMCPLDEALAWCRIEESDDPKATVEVRFREVIHTRARMLPQAHPPGTALQPLWRSRQVLRNVRRPALLLHDRVLLLVPLPLPRPFHPPPQREGLEFSPRGRVGVQGVREVPETVHGREAGGGEALGVAH